MFLYNKTLLLPNLSALYDIFNDDDDDDDNDVNENLYSCNYIYGDRIACKHYCRKEMNIIQIWKTKSLFDYWYDSYSGRNFIATIDYTIHDTFVKINHIGINDYANLDFFDPEEVIKNMLNFVKIVATKENKEKIIIDVHENLRIFLKYYYYIGFRATERKCSDNPFWIETELIL